MREIEFRGKEQDCGSFHYVDWCYGSLVYSPSENQYYIVEHCDEECSFPVDKESIGQYTGLKDKNGRKIFEGDIIIGDIPELLNSTNLIGIVEYQESAFIVKIPNRKSWQIQKVGFCSFINYRVIGNIYDNPELLENQSE